MTEFRPHGVSRRSLAGYVLAAVVLFVSVGCKGRSRTEIVIEPPGEPNGAPASGEASSTAEQVHGTRENDQLVGSVERGPDEESASVDSERTDNTEEELVIRTWADAFRLWDPAPLVGLRHYQLDESMCPDGWIDMPAVDGDPSYACDGFRGTALWAQVMLRYGVVYDAMVSQMWTGQDMPECDDFFVDFQQLLIAVGCRFREEFVVHPEGEMRRQTLEWTCDDRPYRLVRIHNFSEEICSVFLFSSQQ